jgi:hypothetical protein
MALDTVVRVTVDLVMLVVHPAIIVAVGARPLRGIAARMASGANAVSILVIHRERVVEIRVTPVVGIVTLAALAREVIAWPCVT